MQKDVKTGLLIGLAIAGGAGVWLATRSDLSSLARSRSVGGKANEPPPVLTDETPSFITLLPQTEAAKNDRSSETSHAEADEREYDPSQKIVTRRFHIVRTGETLSSIAKQYYGTSAGVGKITQANRIDNPNKIAPGTKLIIPD